eukprot:10180369-Alexandrium_andersonii.AAC.1
MHLALSADSCWLRGFHSSFAYGDSGLRGFTHAQCRGAARCLVMLVGVNASLVMVRSRRRSCGPASLPLPFEATEVSRWLARCEPRSCDGPFDARQRFRTPCSRRQVGLRLRGAWSHSRRVSSGPAAWAR